ncbi:hypothetical protein FHT77_000462 [Rhizobium sp. BK181]|uniref:restriction endonuclease n=1 Tax=Rhizobium sp. BK181 TaxID=2587072 RepID=UPI0016230C4E|nr:restriction endonuclease [Rhizobium sp. BK181]MBB3314620.1 hypothetical protein [Rhizobium sp. BK181]
MSQIRDSIDDLIRRFESPEPNDARIVGAARERALFELFNRCGYNITDLREPRKPALDGAFEASLDGRRTTIALEIKGNNAQHTIVRKALETTDARRREAGLDRALVVFACQLPESAIPLTAELGLGAIDVLGIPELRSWLWKNDPWSSEDSATASTCELMIRNVMQAVAQRLAQAPEEITQLNWLDLERVLREVFDGMGFTTTLTRSTKDGGLDLLLEIDRGGERHCYVVEVKHWSQNKPGKNELSKLVHVTAREQAKKGILLSSSGFTSTVYEGITEAERKTVGLGDGSKIIALCRTYLRLNTLFWTSDRSNVDLLLADLQ